MPAPIPNGGPDLEKAQERFFKEYAQEAQTEFPQLKGHFAAINANTRKFAVKPRGMGLLTRHRIKKNARHSYRVLRKASVDYLPKKDISVLTYLQPMPLSMSIEADVRFTLDHELAHCLIDKELKKGLHYAEIAADVFAMLRHIQHYGTEGKWLKDDIKKDENLEDDYMKRLKMRRTRNLTLGDIWHYSVPALQALKDRIDDIDFKNLTPQQQIDIATDIADNACLADETVAGVRKIFNLAAKKPVTNMAGFWEVLTEAVCTSANENKAAADLLINQLQSDIRLCRDMDKTKKASLSQKLSALKGP